MISNLIKFGEFFPPGGFWLYSMEYRIVHYCLLKEFACRENYIEKLSYCTVYQCWLNVRFDLFAKYLNLTAYAVDFHLPQFPEVRIYSSFTVNIVNHFSFRKLFWKSSIHRTNVCKWCSNVFQKFIVFNLENFQSKSLWITVNSIQEPQASSSLVIEIFPIYIIFIVFICLQILSEKFNNKLLLRI